MNQNSELSQEQREGMEARENKAVVRKVSRVDAYIQSLDQRLRLTATQKEKMRALCDIELEAQEHMTQDSDDDEKPSFDQQVQALLSTEQLEPYTILRAEERENKIELTAYGEMQKLQYAVPLLETERKDKAFQILSEIARQELEDPNAGFDPKTIQRRNQARRDALSSTLTPEQLKAYDAQRSRFRAQMDGGGIMTMEGPDYEDVLGPAHSKE